MGQPKIIFCSTERCRRIFGLENRAGYTFGTFGIVIAPRGWKEYYVAHELIHYWQAENFGSLVLVNGKTWLIEGMAYALSGDPREELHEPFESYRRRFTEWHRLNANIPLKKSVGEALRHGISEQPANTAYHALLSNYSFQGCAALFAPLHSSAMHYKESRYLGNRA